MRLRTAIAIKVLGGLLLHSGPAKHIEDFTPVLYTEKRMVRVTGHQSHRRVTYGVIHGEKLQFSLRHSFHPLYRCWQRYMMRLNFSF